MDEIWMDLLQNYSSKTDQGVILYLFLGLVELPKICSRNHVESRHLHTLILTPLLREGLLYLYYVY